jgi:hypothetical protein
LWLWLALLLATGMARGQGVRAVELAGFTNTTWRYFTNGTDLGTGWVTRAFNDSGWPSGVGLLGVETTPSVYPFPFHTPFTAYDFLILTYYFRTHFELAPSNNIFPLTLVASNLVDDGCAIYLNGSRAGLLRLSAGAAYNTGALAGTPIEGQVEVLTLATNGLLTGDNVLAVEVHQSGAGSSDVVMGLSLWAVGPSGVPVITSPQGAALIAGESHSLSVSNTGGAALYRWQANNGAGVFVDIPGATALSYSNSFPVAVTNQYRAIAYNSLGAVTSSVATVTVTRDTRGPRVLSATVLEEAAGTNRIRLLFDEPLFSLASTSSVVSSISPSILANGTFRVVMAGSNVEVAVSSSTYLSSPPQVFLTVHSNHWFIGTNYYIVLNRILDRRTNVIAPDTTIAVGRPINFDLVAPDRVWSFHAAAVFEPDIYDQPWQAPGYVEGPWWAQGMGVFCGGPATAAPCLGPFQTETGFQPEPTLFRRPFLWPAGLPAEAQFRFAHTVDDGLIVYVNGVESFRTNLPAAPAPITGPTRALAAWSAACATNTVSVVNLVPGTNWLAAAVCQAPTTPGGDMVFGLGLRGSVITTWTLPPEPPPVLEISPAGPGRFRFAWSGRGYALEDTDDLGAGAASAPDGPWTEVPDITNPYTNTFTGPQRFFRLRK